MSDAATTALAIIAGLAGVGGLLSAVVLRRRKGGRARFYFSVRSHDNTDSTGDSDSPSPFPKRKDDDDAP